jgi:hypothetical protein
MKLKHVIQRGNHYQFVCRIPKDLTDFFPSPVIYRTLHHTNEKSVRLLAGAEEFRTQQLFTQLRTGMLSKDLEKRIVASYLSRGADRIEGGVSGAGLEKQREKLSPADRSINNQNDGLHFWDDITTRYALQQGTSVDAINEHKAEVLRAEIQIHKQYLASKGQGTEYSKLLDPVGKLTRGLNVKLTAADKKRVAARIADADIQLCEAELVLRPALN